MTISLPGNDKVNYPEVLALDDKGAAKSSQGKFLHHSDVMMQYLWHTITHIISRLMKNEDSILFTRAHTGH